MKESQASTFNASIFKIQSMLESSIKLQVNILARLTKQDETILFQIVWQEIYSNTRELMNIHSHLSGEDSE